MNNKKGPLEDEMDQILSDSIDEIMGDENAAEEPKSIVTNDEEIVITPDPEEKKPEALSGEVIREQEIEKFSDELTQEDETPVEKEKPTEIFSIDDLDLDLEADHNKEPKEEDEKEIIEEKEINSNDSLRGVFSKEYINLLDSIDDPKLKESLIEEGKKNRSEIDRKRQELGEGKKALEEERKIYANYKGFDELYQKDPKLAIENLAKHSNLELYTVDSNTVQKDSLDDYRLPEEIERDEKLKALEQELKAIKNQRQHEEQLTVQQEVQNFAKTVDTEGNLKHPHFERVKKDMALFFDDRNPDMTMELAYKKAVRFDDELFQIEKDDILRNSDLQRREMIEKAKKLKKQSVKSSKLNSIIANPADSLNSLVDSYYA